MAVAWPDQRGPHTRALRNFLAFVENWFEQARREAAGREAAGREAAGREAAGHEATSRPAPPGQPFG